ncbi:MAG: hypothetical protein H0X72_10920 [Acidobacteria bacterium]|jgi:hypothetical protein|nr:hypothetical protein [Acidobacteriota bacterium]
MIIKKFFVLVICFGLFGNAFAQTTPKNPASTRDVSPELKEKALSLLNNLVRESEQFSLPLNRISARINVADLLWESNEKQARTLFQNAVAELNTMLGQIPSEVPEAEEENYERYAILNDVKNLRNELLVTLAAHDPKFALEALQALSRKNADGLNFFEDDQALELSLAAEIAAKDPKQAYEIAKKNLENGLNYNLFSALEDIYKKDTELGTKLAQDISSKIKNKDSAISSPYDYTSNSNKMMNSSAMNTATVGSQRAGSVINVWEVQSFLDTIKKLNRQAAKDKKPNLLTDNEIKELIGILAQKYVRQPYLSSYEVSKIMPEITKYFPVQAQAIKNKIGQAEMTTLNNLMNGQAFQIEIEDKSADEILQIIEKKPVAERDELYREAAQKAFTDGAVQDAKKFYGRIKTKREYDYLDKQIDTALPLALAEKGDLSEVRQTLAKLKSPEERIEILTALALTVAKGGDRKTASNLLDEARSTYSGRMKNRKNLASILQLAQASAVLTPDQSFSFLESNINYFNDIISAAILLSEFNDYGTVKDDELRLDTVEAESYRNAPKAVQLIKNLAAADFEKTVGLAGKFSRSEVGFFSRYRIAEALLDPNAEENEKNFQSNLSEEQYDH